MADSFHMDSLPSGWFASGSESFEAMDMRATIMAMHVTQEITDRKLDRSVYIAGSPAFREVLKVHFEQLKVKVLNP